MRRAGARSRRHGVAPEPRASHDAALLGGDVYLFGGSGADGPLADLWLLDGAGATHDRFL